MAKVTLLRRSTNFDANLTSYKMILEILSSENITKSIFVKQRIRNYFKNQFEDVFAAIATPVQLEDLDEGSPKEGDSYFRCSSVELVARTPEFLENVFSSIQSEIQKLVIDFEAVNELQADGVYTITADEIDINMAIQHTHYRLPLIARPAGIPETFIDGNENQRQRVINQDVNLTGWLNNTTSPTTYSFKYNLAKDLTLYNLFPLDETKLQYAHLEVNGITSTDVLITATAIYWKSNSYEEVPWPADYLNINNQGSPENKVVLVLDFIK